MKKLRLTAIVVLLACMSVFAQEIEPVLAPAEVILHFSTENGHHEFHLRELISIKYSYRATTPHTYTWVEQSQKLTAGRRLRIECSPSPETVQPAQGVNGYKFENILAASCGGYGRGVGSGCGDCDTELPLGLDVCRITSQNPLSQAVVSTVHTSHLGCKGIDGVQSESPDAFETTSPADYHARAVDKMRKFVRLLGASLSTKQSTVEEQSVKTYSFFAQQQYCGGTPLVPQLEQSLVVTSIKTASQL